jgi:hypothetical protein
MAGHTQDRQASRGSRLLDATKTAWRWRPRPPVWSAPKLTARHEGHHHIGGVSIEVLPPSVVDGGCPRIGVPSSNLDVSQWHPRIQSGHDERCSQHVRVDTSEPSSLANGADPAVSCAPVQSFAIVTTQDRAFRSVTDGKIESAGDPRDQRDHRWLAAFTDDPQRPVSSVEPEVLGVGGAGLADSQAVKAQQDS